MSEKPLPERAKHRLKIAAGLLRGTGRGAKDLNIPREDFYKVIQERIEELSPAERERLKANTDWVEAFDNAPGPHNAQGA